MRRSWPLYVGLAATWLLLLALNIGAPRGDTAGFTETPLIVWWLTQSQVLLMYLKLVVWPSPLLIHYILPEVESLSDGWMYLIPILLLGIATLVLLWRNKPLGFLLAWMFAILSATSLIPIYTETAAERRMYLPLAAIVVMVVVGVWRLALFLRPSTSAEGQGKSVLAYVGVPTLLLAIALGVVSAKRLNAYYDTFRLWQDVVQAQPENYIANLNMGVAFRRLSRDPEAIEYFRKVVRLRPGYAEAHSNLGYTLVRVGKFAEGISEVQVALKLSPNNPYFLNNLGLALIQSGRSSDAIEYLERSVTLKPSYAQAHNSLGLALANTGKLAEAGEQFGIAVSIDPNYANAHCNSANVLASKGDIKNAIAHYESAVQIRPEFVEARYKLAVALIQTGHPEQAIEHFRVAMRLEPKNLQIYAGLVQTLASMHRSGEAIATAQQAIEVARAANDQDGLKQFEGWLKNYQAKNQP
jgi:tetratricopeptide (TPR) repeat protein